MDMRRRIAVIVVFSCMAGPALGDARVDRLAHLGRLYGLVRFEDPYLHSHDVDWDRLVITAIDKVAAADGPGAYRPAIAALLQETRDPYARVVDEGARPGPLSAPDGPVVRTEGGVLLVTVRRMKPSDAGAVVASPSTASPSNGGQSGSARSWRGRPKRRAFSA